MHDGCITRYLGFHVAKNARFNAEGVELFKSRKKLRIFHEQPLAAFNFKRTALKTHSPSFLQHESLMSFMKILKGIQRYYYR